MATTTDFIQRSPDASKGPPFTQYLAGIATVDIGETDTLAIPCGGRATVVLAFPAMNSTSITFTRQAFIGQPFYPVVNAAGNPVTYVIGTGSKSVPIPELAGAYAFTIVCGATQSGGARAIDVQCVGTEPTPPSSVSIGDVTVGDVTLLAPLPPFVPTNGIMDDDSGTIAEGGTSQLAVNLGSDPHYVLLQNVDPAEDLWFDFGQDAELGVPSFVLKPLGVYVAESGFVPSGNLYVNATTTGHPFSLRVG